MITVSNGLVEVLGTKEDLLSDLSSIASHLKEHLGKTEEQIVLAVERGFLISGKMTQETAMEMQKLTKKINGR